MSMRFYQYWQKPTRLITGNIWFVLLLQYNTNFTFCKGKQRGKSPRRFPLFGVEMDLHYFTRPKSLTKIAAASALVAVRSGAKVPSELPERTPAFVAHSTAAFANSEILALSE